MQYKHVFVALSAGVSQINCGVMAQTCTVGWSSVGGGLPPTTSGTPAALTLYYDPVQPAFFAGTTLGGRAVRRWNGSSWGDVGNAGGTCWALAEFDNGVGRDVYAAGNMYIGAGLQRYPLLKWDGSNWAPISGLSGQAPTITLSMAVFDDGHGPALYVGGNFTSAGGMSACGLAVWTGLAWSGVVPECLTTVNVLRVLNENGRQVLYIGGHFQAIGGADAHNIARWDGQTWSALGPGLPQFDVSAIEQFDDGSGPKVFAAGSPGWIERWDGSAWSRYGDQLFIHQIYALASFDDGTGPALYAGGVRQDTSFVGAVKVTPTSFESLGSGVSGGPYVPQVNALTAVDLGSGRHLVAGGAFTSAGGLVVNNIGSWGCIPCYANCDSSTAVPILNVNDFICFQTRFAQGDSYANCDGSTTPPVLNVNDFLCFQTRVAAGCP